MRFPQRERPAAAIQCPHRRAKERAPNASPSSNKRNITTPAFLVIDASFLILPRATDAAHHRSMTWIIGPVANNRVHSEIMLLGRERADEGERLGISRVSRYSALNKNSCRCERTLSFPLNAHALSKIRSKHARTWRCVSTTWACSAGKSGKSAARANKARTRAFAALASNGPVRHSRRICVRS